MRARRIYRARSARVAWAVRGGSDPSGVGSWYWGPRTTPYHRPGCDRTDRGRRLAIHPSLGREPPIPRSPEPAQMLKDYASRAWRIAVTVGPLVAIALTLAAGLKWR